MPKAHSSKYHPPETRLLPLVLETEIFLHPQYSIITGPWLTLWMTVNLSPIRFAYFYIPLLLPRLWPLGRSFREMPVRAADSGCYTGQQHYGEHIRPVATVLIFPCLFCPLESLYKVSNLIIQLEFTMINVILMSILFLKCRVPIFSDFSPPLLLCRFQNGWRPLRGNLADIEK